MNAWIATSLNSHNMVIVSRISNDSIKKGTSFFVLLSLPANKRIKTHYRLWHDLTDRVLEYTQVLEKEQPPKVLIEFYEAFIRDLETKINYLKYARMVVITSRRYEKRTEANEFLKRVSDRLGIDKEAQLLVRVEMAANLLFSGAVVEAGDALVQLKDEIEKFPGADIIIYSEFYKAYALYFDHRKDYEEFYQYALQYLAYTPEATLRPEEKIEWSVKMGMAVLLGRKIYNIGELVEKEILKSLTTTPHLWLYDLLQAMNAARVADFVRAAEHYKTQIASVPLIKDSMDQIIIKMKILALLDLVFTRQKEDRSIPFHIVAKTSEIAIDDVEWLLMKAMSLGLIRGEIDQVESIVKITWMKPRILDPQRVQVMRETVDKWRTKVQGILKDLEDKTAELAKP